MERKNRESSIELLRIMAMLAIISSHFVGATNFRNGLAGIELFIINFLSSASRIAVNIFIIISSWFLADISFVAKRPISIYISLLSGTMPLMLVGVAMSDAIRLDMVLAGVFPFSWRAAWYITAYISFLLLLPFLQQVKRLNQYSHRLLAILVFALVSYTASIPGTNAYDFPSDLLWFPCVFVVVTYIKRFWRIDNVRRVPFYLLAALILYLPIIFTMTYADDPRLVGVADLYRASIKTIPNFAIALLIFASFLSFHNFKSWIVNRFAQTVLWVYVIHTAPIYADVQWKYINNFLSPTSHGVVPVVVELIISVVAVFVVSSLLGVLLKYVIANQINQLSIVIRIMHRLDRAYKNTEFIYQKPEGGFKQQR